MSLNPGWIFVILQCNDAQRDIATLNRHLGTATKECEDLSVQSQEERIAAEKTVASLKGKVGMTNSAQNMARMFIPVTCGLSRVGFEARNRSKL